MKKNKMLKRIVAFVAVVLTVILAVPTNLFASGGEYLVYLDFDKETSLSGVASVLNPVLTTSGKTSGTITLETDSKNSSNKYIKYDKTLYGTNGNVAHYTDVHFGNKSTRASENCKFVFEITFWYSGNISGFNMGQLVGIRKEVPNPNSPGQMKGEIKTVLQIKDGTLYTGAGTAEGNSITSLVAGTKYTVAVAVNDAEKTYAVYLNGSRVKNNISYSEAGTYFTCVRALNLTGLNVSEGKDIPDFYADDIRLYFADKPVCAGGIPSRVDNANGTGGETDGGTTGGGTTGGGTAQTPTTPTVPTTPENGEVDETIGTIKLPKVEQKEFKFTAESKQAAAVEATPTVLESTKDILFICGIGGGAVLIIALMIVFSKKLG